MPVYVIDTLKPKNGLDFPVVEAVDVAVEGYSSLADAVTHFATDVAIAALTDALDGKADKTTTDSLQAQIDQIVITASAEAVVAPEVAAARVGTDGTSYQTLKSRLDTENTKINNSLAANETVLNLFKSDITELFDQLSEYTRTTSIENIFTYVPVGKEQYDAGEYIIEINTNSDLELYIFSGTNTSLTELNLRQSITLSPVQNKIKYVISEDTPFIIGLKGVINYKSGPIQYPKAFNVNYVNGIYTTAENPNYVYFNLSVGLYNPAVSVIGTEVEQARIGVNGIEYDNLEQRLNSEKLQTENSLNVANSAMSLADQYVTDVFALQPEYPSTTPNTSIFSYSPQGEMNFLPGTYILELDSSNSVELYIFEGTNTAETELDLIKKIYLEPVDNKIKYVISENNRFVIGFKGILNYVRGDINFPAAYTVNESESTYTTASSPNRLFFNIKFGKYEIDNTANQKRILLSDLTNEGSYINIDGTIATTSLAFSSSPMYDAEHLTSLHIVRCPQHGANAVAFYRDNTFSAESYISGFGETEDTVTDLELPIPEGAKYVAFSSRDNVERFGEFNVVLTYNILDIALEAIESAKTYPYEGKYISILGDSISTYNGYIPEENRTFFPQEWMNNVYDTWWMKLITNAKMQLLVNNSYSGSHMSDIVGNGTSGYARCEDLDDGVNDPDVIIILMGVNDFANGNGIIGECGQNQSTYSLNNFSDAYYAALVKMKTRYPNARIYLGTIMQYARESFPIIKHNKYLYEFNEAIYKLSELFGAKIIDFGKCGIDYFNEAVTLGDQLHPSVTGHDLMYKEAIKYFLE